MPEATTKDKVDQLKQHSDIQKALEQTTSSQDEDVQVKGKQKIFLGSYVLLGILLSGLYYLVRLRLVHITDRYLPFAQRLLLGAVMIVVVLALSRALDVFIIAGVEDSASRYNIKRIARLIFALLITLIEIGRAHV